MTGRPHNRIHAALPAAECVETLTEFLARVPADSEDAEKVKVVSAAVHPLAASWR